MKKYFILLISILILITLVGCSTNSNNEEAAELDNLKAQLLSAKEENENLKAQLLSVKEERENLKAQLLSVKEERENLVAQMTTLKESHEEIAALATKRNEIITDFEAELNELKETHTENN